MNRPDLDVGEFEVQDGEYLADDQVPESLIELLKQLAIDFVPETQAASSYINDWIDQQADLVPGTEVERGVGLGTFEVRGVTINALAQPYRFYLLKRVQDEFASLDDQDQKDVAHLLTTCGMSALLDLKLSREIGRENNLEVWR